MAPLLVSLCDGTPPYAAHLLGLVWRFGAQPVRGDLNTHHDRIDLDYMCRDRQADRPLARVEARVGDREDLADLDRAGNV